MRTFLVLADELHFGRSAARLRVAQSGVSQTIKALEAEVGVRLFARTRRSVGLTPAGQQFLEHARRAQEALEQGSAAARSAASGESGRLALRFILMSALTQLPAAVARFQRAHPQVSLDIAPASMVDQLHAIRAGLCDIGFFATKGDIAPLAAEVIDRAVLVAVLPAGHRLASRRSVALSDLAGEPFVFLKQSGEPEISAMFRRHCAQAGFEPRIAVEVEQTEALLAFVAAGFGVSCAPGVIRRLDYRGAITVPIRPAIRTAISAVWHPGQLSAVGRRFLAVLRDELAARPRPRGALTAGASRASRAARTAAARSPGRGRG